MAGIFFFFFLCVWAGKQWPRSTDVHDSGGRTDRQKTTMRRERPHQRRGAVICASAVRRQTVDADRLYLDTMRMQANRCNDPINCALALVRLILLFYKTTISCTYAFAFLWRRCLHGSVWIKRDICYLKRDTDLMMEKE